MLKNQQLLNFLKQNVPVIWWVLVCTLAASVLAVAWAWPSHVKTALSLLLLLEYVVLFSLTMKGV